LGVADIVAILSDPIVGIVSVAVATTADGFRWWYSFLLPSAARDKKRQFPVTQLPQLSASLSPVLSPPSVIVASRLLELFVVAAVGTAKEDTTHKGNGDGAAKEEDGTDVMKVGIGGEAAAAAAASIGDSIWFRAAELL